MGGGGGGGGVRVTVMFVGLPAYRDLEPVDSYWPDWARALWALCAELKLCPAATAQFRELRPIAEKSAVMRERAHRGQPTFALDDDRSGRELHFFHAEPTAHAVQHAATQNVEWQRFAHNSAYPYQLTLPPPPNFAQAFAFASPPSAAAAARAASAPSASSSAPSAFGFGFGFGAADASFTHSQPPQSGAAPTPTPSHAQSTIQAARLLLSKSSSLSPASAPRAASASASASSPASSPLRRPLPTPAPASGITTSYSSTTTRRTVTTGPGTAPAPPLGRRA
jgi:hypothetical protein